MNVELSVESPEGFESAGVLSLTSFLEANIHALTTQEASVIHSHLVNVGEYVGGGGSAPFYKLEKRS